MITGAATIVASLSSSELHLKGKRASVVLNNMMDRSFPGEITDVIHGQHVPTVVFTFDQDTIFSGQELELTSDQFNNLYSVDIRMR